MATATANGLYSFDTVYHGRTLEEWVQLTHRHNAEQSGWLYAPLKKGAFGFDNLAVSIGHVLDRVGVVGEIDATAVAELVHQGWCINYVYWRDNRPWESGDRSKPFQPLGDARRDKCAVTEYAQLPLDEQEKDLIIAKFLLSMLEK